DLNGTRNPQLERRQGQRARPGPPPRRSARRSGRAAHHGDGGVRPGEHPRGAPLAPSRAGRSAGAAAPGSHAPARILERGVRCRARRCPRRAARAHAAGEAAGLRRHLPGGRAAVPRGTRRGARLRLALSALGRADERVGPGGVRQEDRGAAGVRRHAGAARGFRGAQLRCGAPRGSPRRGGPMRRAGGVPHLCIRGARVPESGALLGGRGGAPHGTVRVLRPPAQRRPRL
ncbi:MAG: COG2102: Predicted ATPases of PP-loop superfamily, partial [uncultured Gemmatimonadetes bacterium]